MATTIDPPVRAAATALVRARRGDRRAFGRLTEPYRRELIAYCYRLTGTLTEAEDMVQEAFLRAFKALETFEGRASLRAWLYKIAHNLCLNHVQRRPPGWESLDEVGEIALRGAAPDAEDAELGRENVRLGFAALVQSLPPRQRAALVLRDVLGWSAEETARILETTVPAVKNALGRARRTLASHPSGGDPADVHDLAASDPQARETVAEWVDAFEKGNTVRMVALLTGEWPPQSIHSQSGYDAPKRTRAANKNAANKINGEKTRKDGTKQGSAQGRIEENRIKEDRIEKDRLEEREERTHGERQRA